MQCTILLASQRGGTCLLISFVCSIGVSYEVSCVLTSCVLSRVTIAPDDVCSITLFDAATGLWPSRIPERVLRFNVLSLHPGAAGMDFKRKLDLVKKYLIGWSIDKNLPYARGGILGTARGYAM